MTRLQTETRREINWQRPFFTIWTGQALSLLGSHIGSFALIWWLTETTGSATILATAVLVTLLPDVVLGPFIGTLVDRWNRRWIMFSSDAIIALLSAVLAYLFWIEAVQLWHVYVIMFLRALGASFHRPTMTASTSLMIPKAHLTRIQGLNQSLQGLMSIIAPPLGALFLGILPIYTILGIDVATAIFAVAPLLFIAIPQPQPTTAQPASVWSAMRAGLNYLWQWRGMPLVVSMVILIQILLFPAISLQPILVTQYFNGNAFLLAWFSAAFGIGIVAGGLTLSAWGGGKQRIITSMVGVMGIGAGILLVGLTPVAIPWLALIGLMIAGAMNSVANAPLFALLQDKVAPEMQGRVFSLLMSLSGMATPIAMLVAGPVSDIIGVQVWYLLAGIMCLLIGIYGLSSATIRHLEQSHDIYLSRHIS